VTSCTTTSVGGENPLSREMNPKDKIEARVSGDAKPEGSPRARVPR